MNFFQRTAVRNLHKSQNSIYQTDKIVRFTLYVSILKNSEGFSLHYGWFYQHENKVDFRLWPALMHCRILTYLYTHWLS